MHPVAYLTTAAGISGIAYCDKIGAISYELLFLAQLGAFSLGRPYRMPRASRALLTLALNVPIATVILAALWAWNHPVVDLWGMVRYHGLVNAIGHVGLGFLAFAWGRPASHSPIQSNLVETA